MKGDLFTENELAVLLNEYMRRYIDEPESFTREWESIVEFLDQEDNGDEPSYGQNVVAYLVTLRDKA